MVMPDGHVQPCCYNGRDMGNINQSDFEAIWNGGAYRELRASLLAGDYQGAGCGDCALYARSGWTPEQVTQSRLGFAHGTPQQLGNAQLAAREISEGRTCVESRPAALALELSQACNFDCTFCFQEDKLLGIRGDRVRSIVNECLPTVRELIMTGGDPFAYKENVEILRALSAEQAKHMSVEFYTNGALLDRHWDLIERFDNVFMVVSLHSLVNETYQRIMGSKDPVERALRNIDRFLATAKSKPNWRLSLTNIVMRSTLGEIKNLARFAIERNAAVSFVHMHGQYEENIYLRPELIEDRRALRTEITEAIALLESAGPQYASAVANLRFIEGMLFTRPTLGSRLNTTVRKLYDWRKKARAA
jgi:molybdenum cofactor biosynthesis enzyme MoaA